MRSIYLYLVFVVIMLSTSLLSAQSLQTIKTYYDPLFQTQLHEVYTVISGTPTYQGTYKEYDKNGMLSVEGFYQNGLKHGVFKEYNGKYPLANRTFKNGAIEGKCSLYSLFEPYGIKKEWTVFDGNTIEETTYYNNGKKESYYTSNGVCNNWSEQGIKLAEYKTVNGKAQGKSTHWHSNGKIFYEGNYENGFETGVWKYYYEEGNLASEIKYEKGVGLTSFLVDKQGNILHKDSLISEKEARYNRIQYDSVSHKKCAIYQFRISGEDELKDGEYKRFDESGRLILVSQYSSGKKNGIENTYNKEGIVVGGRYFVSDKLRKKLLYDGNGLMTGEIEYSTNGNIERSFYPSGENKTVLTFLNNGTCNYEEFYQNGVLREKGSTETNELLKTGTWITQFDNGKLETKGNYKSGFKVGKWDYFASNGDFIRNETYDEGGTMKNSKTAEDISKESAMKEIENLADEMTEKRAKFDKTFIQEKSSSDTKLGAMAGMPGVPMKSYPNGKVLYEKALSVINDYNSKFSSETNPIEKLNLLKKQINFYDSLFKLESSKMEELNKSLKKIDSVIEIDKIITGA